MRFSSLASIVTLAGLATLTACGSKGTGTTGGAGGGASSSSSASSGGGGSSSSSSSSASSGGGAGGSGPIAMCSDIGALDCFSNFDCAAASDRCEDLGTADAPVPCCVPGPRGTGKGGDPCQDENDCDTAICVLDAPSPGMNRCSKVCNADSDCPADIPNCVTLVAGANGSFCL